MASRYLQDYPIPPEFPVIIRELAKEILRLQPQNIIEFSAKYFRCKLDVTGM
jgi:Regulatory subunit of type II PKA R-subunit